MRVALVAVMDNGNTMRHLARGLRDYCGVDATLYMLGKDTHVNVPDGSVARLTVEEGKVGWLGTMADALITNDHTYFQFTEELRDRWQTILVKCNGTYARKYGPWFEADRQRHGTTYVTSPADYTLASALGFSIQTLGPLIDHRLLPKPDQQPGKIIVGHCPTSDAKGTQEVIEALQTYRKRGDIEIDLVEGQPWSDCVQRKARHHIHIDQWNTLGAFGINAVEALALGSLVINSPLHPYVRMHYTLDTGAPDTPFIDYQTLKECVHAAINHIHERRKQYLPIATPHGRQWALRHFDIKHQAPRWHKLIQHLIGGEPP